MSTDYLPFNDILSDNTYCYIDKYKEQNILNKCYKLQVQNNLLQEYKDLQKNNRKIRNRIAAHRSRIKKLTLIETLQNENDKLRLENDKLRLENDNLRLEK